MFFRKLINGENCDLGPFQYILPFELYTTMLWPIYFIIVSRPIKTRSIVQLKLKLGIQKKYNPEKASETHNRLGSSQRLRKLVCRCRLIAHKFNRWCSLSQNLWAIQLNFLENQTKTYCLFNIYIIFNLTYIIFFKFIFGKPINLSTFLSAQFACRNWSNLSLPSSIGLTTKLVDLIAQNLFRCLHFLMNPKTQ